jgi:hypothetical protein
MGREMPKLYTMMKRWRGKRKRPGPRSWLNPHRIDCPENAVLYQNWIWSHTGKLVNSVASPDYHLTDLDMFLDADDKVTRTHIMWHATWDGGTFRRLMLDRLRPHVGRAKALLVTMDWHPAQRHLVYAAAELGIPTILLPHESIFANRDMYYRHPKRPINAPACDIVLSWGALQTGVFLERGYPADRIFEIGAPKLDYLAAAATGDRSPAVKLGLDPNRRITTFAAQPLDSQYDAKLARAAQNHAIDNVICAAIASGSQVILRLPPSKDSILSEHVLKLVNTLPDVVLDDPEIGYRTTAEETVQISDMMVSINSTMLLEAALIGKVAVTTKYIEFDQIWDNLQIPVARNMIDLHRIFDVAITDPGRFTDAYNISWAAREFSNGAFDGKAADRARGFIELIASGQAPVTPGYARTVPFYNAEDQDVPLPIGVPSGDTMAAQRI